MSNFVQTDVNYASEYSRALGEAYPYLSYFGAIWASPNAGLYRPGMGRTMYIPTVSVGGARAANRDSVDGRFARNWNSDWQAVTLEMDREWDTLVDPMDIAEGGDVATIANITRTFTQFQKVPEMDAYLASKLAGFADAFGGTDTIQLTAGNILGQWDAYLEEMANRRVNRDRLVAYVTPKAYRLLKEAAGITRFLNADGSARELDRNVARLDGVTLVEVPADLMKTAYAFTEGWAVKPDARQVNLMLVDPLAVAAPVKYETSMLSAPTAQSRGKYLYYERYYYGAFSLMDRGAGFFANLSAAPELGALRVTSNPGKESGQSVVAAAGDLIFGSGRPAAGYALYCAAGQEAPVELTYGAALDGEVEWTEMAANPATLDGQEAGTCVTVALVERTSGKVVAGGSAAVVVKE